MRIKTKASPFKCKTCPAPKEKPVKADKQPEEDTIKTRELKKRRTKGIKDKRKYVPDEVWNFIFQYLMKMSPLHTLMLSVTTRYVPFCS
jgi:hypothetical protein